MSGPELRGYHVGGMFDPEQRQWPVGPHLWMDDGVRLAVFLPNAHPEEINAVNRGVSRFAWVEAGVNGFLLFRFGVLPWNDAPFNPQRMSQPFSLGPLPRRSHKPVYTFLVDAGTGVIAAMRMVTWPAYFFNRVVAGVYQLEGVPYTEAAGAADQRAFYRRYPDSPALHRLVKSLPMEDRCTGGQREDRPLRDVRVADARKATSDDE